MWYVTHTQMPSKPKLWMLADEDERSKIFRYEHPEKPDLWVEVRYSKVTECWTVPSCVIRGSFLTLITTEVLERNRGFHRF